MALLDPVVDACEPGGSGACGAAAFAVDCAGVVDSRELVFVVACGLDFFDFPLFEFEVGGVAAAINTGPQICLAVVLGFVAGLAFDSFCPDATDGFNTLNVFT